MQATMFPISLMLPSALFVALSLTISASALQIQSLNPTCARLLPSP
jgi:hypothetical protein